MRVAKWRQTVYNKLVLLLLNYTLSRYILITIHTSLFYFRYLCEIGGRHIANYISLNMLAIIISIICSRFHFAGSMIFICLILLRLDFAVLNMTRFYKKYPIIFHKNFPQVKLNTRGMWTQASKIVSETVTNPQVQAVGIAVIGALAWKVLDVYDTGTQKDISEADRDAENKRSQMDRDAENKRANDNRLEENRRMAFDKITSTGFSELSLEQQDIVKSTAHTGEIKL